MKPRKSSRRKTDQAAEMARLSPEQIDEVKLRRLAAEVGQACSAWLHRRGIKSGAFTTYPAHKPDASQPPGGGSKV